jgi:hypothetical protein
MHSQRGSFLVAYVVVLGVAFPCFAQAPSAPTTLENLVNAPDAQGTPAVSEGADLGPMRHAGPVARPKDGVQHPDLDKAWAEYDAAVTKAAERIRLAITKQFNTATAKGDLNAAEKWQTIGDKFEKDGQVPSQAAVKAAIIAPLAELQKAKDELAHSYESVIKALTVEKNIPEAQRVRDESQLIKPSGERPEASPQVVFLSELEAFDVVVGHGAFGTNGNLGFLGRRITVQGAVSPKGISMHPPTNGASRAVYRIPKGFTHFEANVAIDDSALKQPTAVTFKVFGANRGKPLWESKPLRGAGQSQECVIELKGVKTLTLIVECPGPQMNAHAVWCDPRLVVK